MRFRDADRAQAVQVGAILLFGILIIGLSLYQATVVPQQNERVEFDAYQETSSDLLSVRDGVTTAATRDTASSTTVLTGATYPARAIFVNPGTPTGTLSTGPTEPVTLDGVRAIGSEPQNVQRFWDGAARAYPTSRLTFTPSYNEFDAPPMVLTGEGLYRTTGSQVVPLSTGSFVNGNRITLVTLRGDLSASGLSTPVTAEPVSAATRTVVVTGDGATFNITVPTPGDATAWNDSVGSRIVANPNVLSTTPHANGTVTVTFEGNRRYELRLAAVELRQSADASVVAQPDPSYIVPVTPNGTAASEQPTPVTVEVRDRYDNPVSGTDVTLSIVEGQGEFVQGGTSRTVATDGEGRATAAIRPVENYAGNLTVRAQGDFDGSGAVEPIERTDVGVTVPSDLDSINAPGGNVALGASATVGGNQRDQAVITFNNTADEPRTLVGARIAFYYQSDSNSAAPTEWRFADPSRSTTYDIGDVITPVSPAITLPANQETTITFDFDSPDPDSRNDFIVLGFEYENAGSGTYFVFIEA
ncbi:hypothetical protein [Haloplanus halobius]|uniref:hypothetical protein n=1 Tax=Haloplanus halobius TaxID=2934938 RepID=UPI0020109E1F|nr:hypothetical protein [Haloplanus sp. XH21]